MRAPSRSRRTQPADTGPTGTAASCGPEDLERMDARIREKPYRAAIERLPLRRVRAHRLELPGSGLGVESRDLGACALAGRPPPTGCELPERLRIEMRVGLVARHPRRPAVFDRVRHVGVEPYVATKRHRVVAYQLVVRMAHAEHRRCVHRRSSL